jgi:hypothetical protein
MSPTRAVMGFTFLLAVGCAASPRATPDAATTADSRIADDASGDDAVAGDDAADAALTCHPPAFPVGRGGCAGYVKGHDCAGCACAAGYFCTWSGSGPLPPAEFVDLTGTVGICCVAQPCGSPCTDNCDCASLDCDRATGTCH